MEEHLDYPIFKGGVVNSDEFRSALPQENAICAHLCFRLHTFVIGLDQLQSAWGCLRLRAIDMQLNCNDISQPRYHVSIRHTAYLGCLYVWIFYSMSSFLWLKRCCRLYSCWYLPSERVRNPSFDDRFQRMLIFLIPDRDGTLIKVVCRDGKFLGSSWWQVHSFFRQFLNFLRYGVSRSFTGTRICMLTMSAMFVSEELNAQVFNVKRMENTAPSSVQQYWVGCTRLDCICEWEVCVTHQLFGWASFAALCSHGQFSMQYSGGNSETRSQKISTLSIGDKVINRHFLMWFLMQIILFSF